MNSESTETSVTASIEELLRIERRRVEDEAAARRARHEAERRAAEEARAEEEALRRCEDERRAREAFVAAEQAHAEREAGATGTAQDVARGATAAPSEAPATPPNTMQLRQRSRTLLVTLAVVGLTCAGGAGLALHATENMDNDRASAHSRSAQTNIRIDEIERALHAESDALNEVEAKLDTLISHGSMAPPVVAPAPALPRAPRVPRLAPPIAPVSRCKQGDPICSDLP